MSANMKIDSITIHSTEANMPGVELRKQDGKAKRLMNAITNVMSNQAVDPNSVTTKMLNHRAFIVPSNSSNVDLEGKNATIKYKNGFVYTGP